MSATAKVTMCSGLPGLGRVWREDLAKDKRPQPMPLDALNLELRHQYFGGGGGNGPHNDALLVAMPDGKTLLHMRTWMMAPESAEVAENDAGAKGYRVSSDLRLPGRGALLRTRGNSKRVGWTCGTTRSGVGDYYVAIGGHIRLAFRSWRRAAATVWCGTTLPSYGGLRFQWTQPVVVRVSDR